MATEHERIEENTNSIGIISRRLDRIEQLLGGEFKAQPAFAARPTYSFAFGATPFELGGAVAATAAATWIPMWACDDFYENTTPHPETVTITISNTNISDPVTIDIDGTVVATIEAGKTKRIIVTIPGGKSLHAGVNGGEYLL